MASEWINALSPENKALFEETIIELYHKGVNSTEIMKVYYQWEDDTRLYNGLPARVTQPAIV